LASSVPDLHFNFDAINVNGFDFEIHTDGGNVGDFIFFICVSEKNVSFSDS